MEPTWPALPSRVAPWVLSALSATQGACGGNDSIAQGPEDWSNSAGIGSASGTGAAGGLGMPDSGAGGAGGCGTGTGAVAGAGGSIQADDPCASLTAPGASDARVVWLTGGDQSMNISFEVSLLWSFQYAVRVAGGRQNEYSLVHERCETPAGGPRSCSSGELALSSAECGVSRAPKFGVDPSQYEVGKNIYEFTLRLRRGSRTASTDSFRIELTYAP